ncbi:MAG: tyrosine-type recombinase/integrase [Candidatus Thermoplasmatota archaeon]|nr:tyrosine-type recombinase/integrase [Candidatus Thermoplasmatota archaeon]
MMDLIENWIKDFDSIGTRRNHSSRLKTFFKFVKIKPEAYIKDKTRDIKKDFREFRSYLSTEKNLEGTTITNYLASVRLFLDEHDVVVSPSYIRKIQRRGKLPKTTARDRIPTVAELQGILQHADALERAFFLMMASSGCREEELCRMTIDDIEWSKYPVKVNVRAEVAKDKAYRFTFMSPEATKAVHEWLKRRTKLIIEACKKSHFDREKFQKLGYDFIQLDDGWSIYKNKKKITQEEFSDSIKRIFPYEPQTIRDKWNRCLRETGLGEKDPKTGWYVVRLYTLRKFFNTRLKDVCKRDMVELWLGHEEPYDRWTYEEHAQEYLNGCHKLFVYERPMNQDQIESLQEQLDGVNKRFNEFVDFFTKTITIQETELENEEEFNKRYQDALKVATDQYKLDLKSVKKKPYKEEL